MVLREHTPNVGVCGITPKGLMFMPLVFSDIASLEVVNSKNTV